MSERSREIRRRRQRRKKLNILSRKLKAAPASERTTITTKLRRMTAGAEVIIDNWGLGEAGR
ncbi:MAG: DUF6800 family protein [Pirellulales bacterium]